MRYALIVIACLFGQAHAALIRYDMTFVDNSGVQIGQGYYAYDDANTVDLYETVGNNGPAGQQCWSPGPDCQLAHSWNPLSAVQIAIAGLDAIAWNSDGDLYAQGGYTWHNRYDQGGYTPGYWFIGDIYFGDFQLGLDIPTTPMQSFVSSFFLYEIVNDMSYGGQVFFTQAVPLPAAAWMFLAGLFGIQWWRGRG